MDTGGHPAIYLDNNASTPPLPEVRDAVLAALGPDFSNPSSAHSMGGLGKQLLTQARERVAALLGVPAESVYFTSSGTEANNWAIRSGMARDRERPKLVTTAIEHSSVLKQAAYLAEVAGQEVCYAPVLSSGQVDLEALDHLIDERTALVSVQWVNNETGVIQPVEEAARLARERGALFHTDAAQAAGKLELAIERVAPEFLTLTGHKLHGPQGVGAMMAKGGENVLGLFYGGGQEGGLRPGTENTPGIIGLGKAAEIRNERLSSVLSLLAGLRDRFEAGLFDELEDVEVNGDPELRVGNTANLLFRGIEGQALMARLDQADILCSQSSACTNSRPEPSYVLREMGRTEDEAYASVRFSFSELNTEAEVDRAVETIAEMVDSLRAFARFGA